MGANGSLINPTNASFSVGLTALDSSGYFAKELVSHGRCLH
jgi:hypothetical protein